MANTSGSRSSSGKKKSSTGRSSSSAGRKTTPAKRTSSTAKRSTSAARSVRSKKNNEGFSRDLGVILLFAGMIFLFLSNFGIMGKAGEFCSGILFGLFGWSAYFIPVFVFAFIMFLMFGRDPAMYIKQIIAVFILLFLFGVTMSLLHESFSQDYIYRAADIYRDCGIDHSGGGVIFGSAAYLLYRLFRMAGTILFMIVLLIIAFLLFTGSSLMDIMSGTSSKMEKYRSEAALRRAERIREREEYYEEGDFPEEDYPEDEEDYAGGGSLTRPVIDTFLSRKDRNRRLSEERENDRILSGRKVRGVVLQNLVPEEEEPEEDNIEDYNEPDAQQVDEPYADESIYAYESSDLHEITGFDGYAEPAAAAAFISSPAAAAAEKIVQGDAPDDGMRVITPATEVIVHKDPAINKAEEPEPADYEGFSFRDTAPLPAELQPAQPVPAPVTPAPSPAPVSIPAPAPVNTSAAPATASYDAEESIAVHRDRGTETASAAGSAATFPSAPRPAAKKRAKYVFPSMDLLHKGNRRNDADTDRELRETAIQLEDTLRTFGVNITITDISQGPAVTRYELLPEQGVKVSKILSLQDDIKMHLAATDIRIEAPIPGKAAIGIEVPNKENSVVSLRDVLETSEYQNFKGKLPFPVGKDIAGMPVVFDIAKMPHVLIAGATGSGKSVCINTIIMGLLYKTTPEECKLIMIDPKIVELSVYNGIPHLMIPVVTDPKKASAALAWAVAEMTERYGKFADAKVRDLMGYNEKMKQLKESGEDPDARTIPTLVIIVDELADLMMVSANEVEESICRLAQLARAAGIHLIIATQRPSVDVITGLIKANMPSRVAFAVSSGVDSRTILDMVGAEKLLGKGDMLFYPQGYPKPARIQGAFVTDDEVSDVVSFIKEHNQDYSSDEDVDSKIDMYTKADSGAAAAGQSGGGTENDPLFADAGRFIIEKQKASIGLLQRAFKIGFNRAARIMDQLADAGVVSEEDGTKARNILMDMMAFENYLESQ